MTGQSAGLDSAYDGVVMLTSSNWAMEPRSNRYHYATRFARRLPTLFVQPTRTDVEDVVFEQSGVPGLDLLSLPATVAKAHTDEVIREIRERRLRRPLFWIYNAEYSISILDAFPNAIRVYHLTEDLFTESNLWDAASLVVKRRVQSAVKRLLPTLDLVVAVSNAVAESCRQATNYKGRMLVAENGCDYEFFKALDAGNASRWSKGSMTPVAIYQGGINRRLDYYLLHRLVHLLPDWHFRFVGLSDDRIESWDILRSHPNFESVGAISPDEVAHLMCAATIGIIPYRQSELIKNSLPLKAFEYVACGLPVITVPIDALAPHEGVFEFAKSAEEFASAMVRLAASRFEPDALSRRFSAAASNSYDVRFTRVEQELLEIDRSARTRVGSLNVAVLYDDRSGYTRTIVEHLDAFRIYSRHRIHFVPATGDLPEQVDLNLFDVVIHHYCVRLSLTWHLNENLARQVEHFTGLKILFIQDEYDATETARRWIERLGFNIVYTCVPPESINFVYPRDRFPFTDFLPTLTGFVPELDELDSYSLPIEERSTLVAYRGRNLPFQYGELCQQKRRIGEQVKAYANRHGYPVDIETDDAHRIYGSDWYRFMGSARSTLGTESGSNVFDFDGEITREVSEATAKNPELSFEEVSNTILAPHEGLVRMNQASPKIFEAIRLRTILVLYEGNYSGVVTPGVHYIALKKDGSNLDEVFASLQNIEFLKCMAERAYDDVITSGRYSYKTFIDGVDSDIGNRVLRRARFRIYSSPVLIREEKLGFNVVVREGRTGHMLVTTNPLFGDIQREQYLDMVQAQPQQADDPTPNASDEPISATLEAEAVQHEQSSIDALVPAGDATPNAPDEQISATLGAEAVQNEQSSIVTLEQAGDATWSAQAESVAAVEELEAVQHTQRSIAVRTARRFWRLIPQRIRWGIWSRLNR